jgi:aryl-alcohol dehydrogenase-like predicted oxidoreductase
MSATDPLAVNRRDFLQAGAIATATALSLDGPSQGADDPPASKSTLPRRPLGKTGVELTILDIGTWQSPGLDKLVRMAYARGVRVFDAADCYGSEPGLARWFRERPEVRKDIFLVTKDHPNTPRDLIRQLDTRLAALQTDYVDLFFIHGLGSDYGPASIEWPRSREFRETIEAIKASGKAKFVGFSTHDRRRAEYIQAAADGGFVDAIMLQYSPWLAKDAPLNRALDACHRKGIGLISMKQVAGQFRGNPTLAEVFKRAPVLKKKGLTPYQGLLHAIWTDERITTCCISMRNTDQIRDNVAAALSFEPLKQAELDQIRDASLAAGPTLCADCDGRCARAGGTDAALGDLTRLLTYHEHHGYRGEARRLFAALGEHERRWHDADLDAARAACPNHLDFARLLPEVDRHLA